jgi:FixJ family two-component response regulator
MIDAMVFVVDDDASVRQSLELLFQNAGYQVETYANARDFLARARYQGTACLVMDVCMPGLNGLDAQRRLAVEDYRLPIIFISGQSDIPISVRAMKEGAVDFLPKPVDPDDLLQVVAQALARGRQSLIQQAETAAIKKRLSQLTPREWDVFRHLLTGQLNKQIAADLSISETTVKIHRRRVLHKMQVQSVVELSHLVEQADGVSIPGNLPRNHGRTARLPLPGVPLNRRPATPAARNTKVV